MSALAKEWTFVPIVIRSALCRASGRTHYLSPTLQASRTKEPRGSGALVSRCLPPRILTGVLRRRWRVALARRWRAIGLSGLSRLRVLVGGGLIAALADRGLILRSGLCVLLSRWLLLRRRLLCCSALALAAALPGRRLVLRRRRVRLAVALAGRVLLRLGLALAVCGRVGFSVVVVGRLCVVVG